MHRGKGESPTKGGVKAFSGSSLKNRAYNTLRMIRRSFVIIVLLATLSIASETEPRVEFLLNYYKGDYPKAHDQLNSAYSDPIEREIWENRIHLQENIPNCHAYDPG